MSIEENISLAECTTLKVGGVARYFATLTDLAELPTLVEFAEAKSVPILVLGGGSNMLIADGTLERLIIKNELRGVSFEEKESGEALVTAAAGEEWDVLVEMTVERGLAGLENLSGIPGTVGAAPIQNINAYGASAANAIVSVTVFDVVSKRSLTLTAEECLFGYRDSVFKQPAGANLIVTAVTFRLAPAGSTNLSYQSSSQSISTLLAEKGITDPSVSDVRQAVLRARSNIGMLVGQYHSAGSFFKNVVVSAEDFNRIKKIVSESFSEQDARFSPWHWHLDDGSEKISTAFFMECSPYNKSTWGEERRNGVGISPKHSLSIVTESGATATSVKEFSEMIIKEIKETFGVTIESEVNYISS